MLSPYKDFEYARRSIIVRNHHVEYTYKSVNTVKSLFYITNQVLRVENIFALNFVGTRPECGYYYQWASSRDSMIYQFQMLYRSMPHEDFFIRHYGESENYNFMSITKRSFVIISYVVGTRHTCGCYNVGYNVWHYSRMGWDTGIFRPLENVDMYWRIEKSRGIMVVFPSSQMIAYTSSTRQN